MMETMMHAPAKRATRFWKSERTREILEIIGMRHPSTPSVAR